jgi:hypothetical protein
MGSRDVGVGKMMQGMTQREEQEGQDRSDRRLHANTTARDLIKAERHKYTSVNNWCAEGKQMTWSTFVCERAKKVLSRVIAGPIDVSHAPHY